jgi:hypothetical protein
LARLSERYPEVKAVVWFDSPYPGDPDFRLQGERADSLRTAFAGSDYWGQPIRLAGHPER